MLVRGVPPSPHSLGGGREPPPGDTLKLRGTPKAPGYQAAGRKAAVARLAASGTVTTPGDTWAIRSHAPTSPPTPGGRYGAGPETRWAWVGGDTGLRYSPLPGETPAVVLRHSRLEYPTGACGLI